MGRTRSEMLFKPIFMPSKLYLGFDMPNISPDIYYNYYEIIGW
jgi:hypothetical protein